MICIMCAGACGTESGTSDRGGDNPVAVRTVVMQKSTDIRTRSYVGQAKASRGVVLLSPYSGTLTMLEVRVGETVSTGDVVAEIYSEINKMEKAKTSVDTFPVYEELFGTYVFWALLALMLELLLNWFVIRRLP